MRRFGICARYKTAHISGPETIEADASVHFSRKLKLMFLNTPTFTTSTQSVSSSHQHVSTSTRQQGSTATGQHGNTLEHDHERALQCADSSIHNTSASEHLDTDPEPHSDFSTDLDFIKSKPTDVCFTEIPSWSEEKAFSFAGVVQFLRKI
jgi:hypothetical protein